MQAQITACLLHYHGYYERLLIVGGDEREREREIMIKANFPFF